MNRIRYYDTHAHYGQRYRKTSFYDDREEILREAYQQGIVKVVNVAIGMTSNVSMLEDFKNYPSGRITDGDGIGLPQVRIAIGEHPKWIGIQGASYLDKAKDEELRRLCVHERVCAIKTGLDYSQEIMNVSRQQEIFRARIRMSKEMNLPLVLHIRDAYEDAISMLEEESGGESYHGVIHCFTQGVEVARKLIDMGFLLGIGGKVTYHNNQELRETIREIPLDHLVLETDCPYIPLYRSGKVNTSLDIPEIAQVVADLKGVTLNEVAEATYQNAESIFG